MMKRTCLGTKHIRIATGPKASPVEDNGMLLLFLPISNPKNVYVEIEDDENECTSIKHHQHGRSVEEGADALDVMVTNGSITFRGQ